VKLARELARRATGNTLYVLDEPTTGLHFADIEQLLLALEALRDAGNTLVVIEHNLDVVAMADWVIDLGPDGGERGGELVAAGTPEDVALEERSHTGRYLRPLLGLAEPPSRTRPSRPPPVSPARVSPAPVSPAPVSPAPVSPDLVSPTLATTPSKAKTAAGSGRRATKR
jgi:excinuclease ABC subunit A